MKTILSILLLTVFGCLFIPQSAQAQANSRLLFGELAALTGVGKYNGINYGVGASIRYHHPVQSNLALTGRIGLEYYSIEQYALFNGTFYTGSTTYSIPLGQFVYGTQPVTTAYTYIDHSYGINMPVTAGVRYYLPGLLLGLHADLNAGADVGLTSNLITAVHLAPGVGYSLPLARKGRFLDISGTFITNFIAGNGAVGLTAAYGLPVGR